MNGQYGKVYMVGAGPGDEKLITLKGLEALQKADCIVYDRLVNPELLRYVREHAELVFCGKSPNDHTMDQAHINALLVARAKAGKRVVRLKGGDPGIFGRVGEEAAHCKMHGVSFEIVPGVTSGIAAAAFAGISLTHREMNSSVAFVTGHKKAGETEDDFDWGPLATSVETLVFYMGVKNLPRIREELIKHGRSPETPVAIIRWGTLASQRTIVTTVGEMVEQSVMEQVKPPSIIVIGEVVSLREELKWFEELPLHGRRFYFPLLENRSTEHINVPSSVASFMHRLEDKGAEVNVLAFRPCLREDGDAFEIAATGFDYGIADISIATHATVVDKNVSGLAASVAEMTAAGLEAGANDAAVAGIMAARLTRCAAIRFDDPWNAEMFFQWLKRERLDIRKIRAELIAADERTAAVLEDRGVVAVRAEQSNLPPDEDAVAFGLRSSINLVRFEPIQRAGKLEKAGIQWDAADRIVLTDADQAVALAGWLSRIGEPVGIVCATQDAAESARRLGLPAEEWEVRAEQAEVVERAR